jgi:hypothetical protein
MEDSLKALLVRALTFIEIAQALVQQEGSLLRAQIAAELRPESKEEEK